MTLIQSLASALVVLAAADPAPAHVERRLLLKQGRLFAQLGPTYLGRDDYHVSPGVTGSLSYYPMESGGLELRWSRVFSTRGVAAEEVFRRTGLLPEAQRPIALGSLGWRQSFAYGKVLVAGRVLHFDLQLGGHIAALWTDRALTPGLLGSAGALCRLSERLHLQLDVATLATLEQRNVPTVILGVVPSLLGGVAW